MKVERGFTLIELTIVFAMLGIMFAITVPSIISYVETARVSVCFFNRTQFGQYYRIYLEESELNQSESILTSLILEYEEDYGRICPSNGSIRSENGMMKCGKHTEEEPIENEPEEVTYIYSRDCMYRVQCVTLYKNFMSCLRSEYGVNDDYYKTMFSRVLNHM